MSGGRFCALREVTSSSVGSRRVGRAEPLVSAPAVCGGAKGIVDSDRLGRAGIV
jgi:hypothetical protein